jgi:hypothetical protein
MNDVVRRIQRHSRTQMTVVHLYRLPLPEIRGPKEGVDGGPQQDAQETRRSVDLT